MYKLSNQKCVPCENPDLAKILEKVEIDTLLSQVPDWVISEDLKSIARDYVFKDFIKSISFVESVADIAEEEGHHPDIFISYNKVKLTLKTHSVDALTINDFILASKIDNIVLL
jgi:4a-hydroxytetrahydrobiopterin dehydratase